jgi:hypothetical protein
MLTLTQRKKKIGSRHWKRCEIDKNGSSKGPIGLEKLDSQKRRLESGRKEVKKKT